MGTSPVYDAVRRAPRGYDVLITGQKNWRETLAIDVMAQLKVSVLKACGPEDGPELEIRAGGAVGGPTLALWCG